MPVDQSEQIFSSPFSQGRGHGVLRMQTRQELARMLLWPSFDEALHDSCGFLPSFIDFTAYRQPMRLFWMFPTSEYSDRCPVLYVLLAVYTGNITTEYSSVFDILLVCLLS